MQQVANALIASAYIALMGVGFALIHRTSRLMDFGHAFSATSAGYAYYLFVQIMTWPAWLALLLALGVAMLVSGATQHWVVRSMEKQNATPATLMIGSLAIYIVLESTVSLLFGDDAKVIATGDFRTVIALAGARFTVLQVALVAIAATLCSGLLILQSRSAVGLQNRAVGCDPELASVVGIELTRIRMIAKLVAAIAAGLAGVFYAVDVGLAPKMGMDLLLSGAVAALIGRSTIAGTLAGALLLASLRELSGAVIPTKWSNLPVFLVLIGYLVVRKKNGLEKGIASAG